jgi:hypothetical protein
LVNFFSIFVKNRQFNLYKIKTMKKLQLLFVSLLISFVSVAQLYEFLNNQTEIKAIEKITGNDFFNETFEIMVRQPLDHSDTTKGFFLQRVFVADKGKENAVLLITEGYGAGYAANPRYINELSPMLNSNQICVEHRYFGESWPSLINWDFLTVTNAEGDHHAIVELFKKYYSGKWINTGISKGGQTAVYHRAFYPDDVDVTVAYVAPLNFGVEDGRHEPFIKNKPGTANDRQRILDFQIRILKNREVLVPKLVEFSKEKGFEYRVSFDEIFDYTVLEFPFAFWQWGKSPSEIPDEHAGLDECFDYLMNVPGPSYFSISGMETNKSFFVQAARELGYYGYDTKPLRKYLSIKSSKNYLSKIFLPDGLKIKYEKSTAKQVKRFIKTTDSEILFIYGEYDPWSASGFEVTRKDNLLKIVKPGGSHSTHINNLPADQRKQVKEKLEEWLEMPIFIN